MARLVDALEGKYYNFKDTYLEDIVKLMSYEERIADEEGFVAKAKAICFTENEKIVDEISAFDKNEGRKHKLYGITNADLEVFLFLHKNVIHMVSFHMYRSTCLRVTAVSNKILLVLKCETL